MSDVVKFDAEAMRKRLAELVHAGLVQMMPEEALLPYIKQAEAVFLKEELPRLVKEALMTKYRAEIRAYLDSEDFAVKYSSSGQPVPGEAVKEIIRQLTPELVQQLFGEVVLGAVQNLRSSMMATTRY